LAKQNNPKFIGQTKLQQIDKSKIQKEKNSQIQKGKIASLEYLFANFISIFRAVEFLTVTQTLFLFVYFFDFCSGSVVLMAIVVEGLWW
jgi:hypothetical protein